MKRAQKSNRVRIQPAALRRWIVAGTIATTVVGGSLLLIFARLQAGKAVWTDGFYLNGSQWFDAARTTVTLVGIIGLGGAAFLAYRKQVSTEASHLLDQSTSLRDRYTTTAEQLGHDSAAIRLAGVYALASLADDWHDFGNDDERQVCVDLLCAYLRTERPTPSPRPSARSAERIDHQEQNVRSAIIDVLAGRSRKRSDGMDGPWAGLRYALFGADLTRANLASAILTRAILTGANLSSAGLVGANLTRVDLGGANLASAILIGANLTGANLFNANLNSANLNSMNLGAVQLRSTLADANLTGASLVGAHLTGADLTGARLTGAFLTGADLTGAFLTRAILNGADLTGADLTGADLTNVIYDTHTRWPEGFSPPGSISS